MNRPHAKSLVGPTTDLLTQQPTDSSRTTIRRPSNVGPTAIQRASDGRLMAVLHSKKIPRRNLGTKFWIILREQPLTIYILVDSTRLVLWS